MKTITQEILKELLHYDPSTGLITTKHNRGRWGTMQAGTPVRLADTRYPRITVDGNRYYVHRLIFLYMEGVWPEWVDHVDGDTTNYKWENLRAIQPRENLLNRSKCSHNTSGFTGVDFLKNAGKWRAKIQVLGKSIHLGLFDTFEAAKERRLQANREYGFSERHGL